MRRTDRQKGTSIQFQGDSTNRERKKHHAVHFTDVPSSARVEAEFETVNHQPADWPDKRIER